MRNACLSADRALADEQAVRGIDALAELALHPILAGGFSSAGWGVHREIPYPGDDAERARADDTPGSDRDRVRCDLVITPSPADRLADPVHAHRRIARAAGTLFEPIAEDIETRATTDHTEPADAFWLEIKVVGQTRYRQGVPVPNPAYGAELVAGPIADAEKLADDGVIQHAAITLVVFTAHEDIARADLATVTHRLFDKHLPIGSPSIASGPIQDHAGNAAVTVAVFPLRGIGLGEVSLDPL